MSFNKQIKEFMNVSNEDYLQWCKDNKKKAYKRSTKEEFFARISDGRLVKDTTTGKIIKKRRRVV